MRGAMSFVAVLALGCGSTHEVEPDTGVRDAGPADSGVVDAGAPDTSVPDAGRPDTGPPPETCDSPGRIEPAGCGFCGTTERFCTSAGIWEYGACSEAPGAVCQPGTTGTISCGACGTQTARCTESCNWSPTGSCEGEAGECIPGASERDMCSATGTRVRICGESCNFGSYSSCREPPTDFDGDGSDYDVDCDDTDPSVFVGTLQPCGMFYCPDPTAPGGFIHRPGFRQCVGPGWGMCERPAGCPEPTGDCSMSPIPPTESRECAVDSMCGFGPREFRNCRFGNVWSGWSGCPPPMLPPPDICEVNEIPCGGCGEGSRFEYCDGNCNRVTTACLGSGCTPGSVVYSSAGCPPGEVREQVCTAACSLGSPGPCTDAPDVDIEVMLLVDMTGPHGFEFMRGVDFLMGELVMPLLDASPIVHVGVATFADFPVPPYGDPPDIPFHGVLELTDDASAIESALRSLTPTSGGDLEDSAMEALFALTGGAPHPMSRPFSCTTGTAGGCWSPGAQRAIVLLTDTAQHNAPHPVLPPGVLLSPYTSVPPPAPPTWDGVRDRLISQNIQLFVGYADMGPMSPFFGLEQFDFLLVDLGVMDPFQFLVPYPIFDPIFAVMEMRDRLFEHFGL